jgi:hypothetical protein
MKLILMMMLHGDLDLTLEVIQLSRLNMATAGDSFARKENSGIGAVDQASRSIFMEHYVTLCRGSLRFIVV